MKKIIYLFIVTIFACKSQEVPLKHPDLSERKYNQYYTMLKDARAKKDYYWEAISLCNLKQSPELVYKLLNKSIKQHDTLCYQIHADQDRHKTGRLTVNIIKADTLKWKKICEKCEKIVTLEQFKKRQEQETLAYQKKEALKESKLDSNLMDKKLIARLKKMMDKDRLIRGIPFMDSKNVRWKEQKLLDSLNLIQLDSIFIAEKGYPAVEKIGHDKIGIPWYILHHQSSPIVRRKYQHFLEEAVKKGYLGQGALDGYINRTLTTEEYESKKNEKIKNE